MKKYEITEQDIQLIEDAKNTIKKLYKENHHVGAALRTSGCQTISAVHVEAYVGRVTVCAEAIAIGGAIANECCDIETIVAVRHPYKDEPIQELTIVSPCGICRELISDYAPNCYVILEEDGDIFKTTIDELIPLKYKRF